MRICNLFSDLITPEEAYEYIEFRQLVDEVADFLQRPMPEHISIHSRGMLQKCSLHDQTRERRLQFMLERWPCGLDLLDDRQENNGAPVCEGQTSESVRLTRAFKCVRDELKVSADMTYRYQTYGVP